MVKQDEQAKVAIDEQVKPAKDEQLKIAKDWHKADIIAALHKQGLSLASLGRSNGLAASTLNNALSRSWPRGEEIIANALDRRPDEIWPSRYFEPDGTPIKRTLRKPPKMV